MTRRAPVQGEGRGYGTPNADRPDGSMPWTVHEEAARAYNAFGYGQSAERLAERGGFGYSEAQCLLAGHDPFRESFPCSRIAEHKAVPGWEPIALRERSDGGAGT